MPKFKILASREVFYEFEIDADSKHSSNKLPETEEVT
jgi:hypothetical protein